MTLTAGDGKRSPSIGLDKIGAGKKAAQNRSDEGS